MPQDPEQQPKVDDAPDPQFPYGATPLAPPASSLYTSPEFYTAQQNTPASPSSYRTIGIYCTNASCVPSTTGTLWSRLELRAWRSIARIRI